MSTEKYLDYSGLEYYHEKLNVDLANIAIDSQEIDSLLFDKFNAIPSIPTEWTTSANGTLDMSLSNAFSFEPEGAGTKTISIVNGTSFNDSTFFLKLIDAGNFLIEWGSNIQWKDGNEPDWQPFYEDIILFTKNNNENTWTAQVVQSNAITPYWKLTVSVNNTDRVSYNYIFQQSYIDNMIYRLPFYLPSDAEIDWGDGTSECSREHSYSEPGTYHIKVSSNMFDTEYIINWISDETSEGCYLNARVVSIDSPMPSFKGSYIGSSTSKETVDNSFEDIFQAYSNLQSIPEKLFWNLPAITNLDDAFHGCPLENFTLYISSPNISSISADFCDPYVGKTYTFNGEYYEYTGGGNTSRRTSTIYAPCGSATYQAFSNQSSELGLTVRVLPNDSPFVYTVTTGSDKKSAIPFTLYNTSNTTFCVDWGDGTFSVLQSSNYQQYNTLASVHTYETAGTYTITVDCNNWNNVYLMQTYLHIYGSDSYSLNSNLSTLGRGPVIPIYYWRTTVTAFNSPLPHFKGTQTYTDDPSDYEDEINETFNNRIILQYCDALQSLPSNLFTNNTSISTLANCFEGCISLQSIPLDIFNTCVNVTSFERCFYGCTSLTTVPNELFNRNIAVTTFSECFSDCTSLVTIPEEIFNTNTNVTSFNYCFYHCSSLEFIPSNLFSKNTAVTNFSSCFARCTSLKLIPPNLFNYNISVTSFSLCFSNCSSIQCVPEGLFDYNTLVTDFAHCFSNCTSLICVPAKLFRNNTQITNLKSCFEYCSSLIHTNLNWIVIEIGSPSVTNCTSFITCYSNYHCATVYVPKNSISLTTFENVKDALKLYVYGIDFN